MNVNDYLIIAPFINDCPNCGYGNVGTDEGTGEYHGALAVDENLFTRKCRCGFEITIDADKGTTKSKLKKAINEALATFNSK